MLLRERALTIPGSEDDGVVRAANHYEDTCYGPAIVAPEVDFTVAAIRRLQALALDETAGLTRAAVLSAGGLIAEERSRMQELRLELPASLKRVREAWKSLRRKL